MSIFSSAKLEKATIRSYIKPEREGLLYNEYGFMFNPESYSISFQNNYSKAQGLGCTSSTANFLNSSPETLRFKIIIDATGVEEDLTFANLRSRKNTDRVAKEIKFLREHIIEHDGDIHQPRYLVVIWGSLNFPCRLESAQVNYTLFDKDGIPLRAEVDVTFFYDRERKIQKAIENKKSPDLTHVRIVKAHDQLPLMCEEIYGASQYYVHVAKANNLSDFRNLKPGQEIYFPPIEK